MRPLLSLSLVAAVAALSLTGCSTVDRVTRSVDGAMDSADRAGRTAGRAGGGAQSVGLIPVRASWETTASQFGDRPGVRVQYECPAGGEAHSVWGTDVYSSDSSVCTAAVHMGLISMARGGTVVVQIRPGEESYSGTTHNGVRSSSYGRWGSSFTFVR